MSDSTNAGLRPDCSVPLTGSNSTHAMSPTSGNILLSPDIVERNLAARVSVVDNLGPDIRAPVDRLRLVFRTEPLHLGNKVLQSIVLDRQWLPHPEIAAFDGHVDLGARLQAHRLDSGLGQSEAQAVAPFGKFDLHDRSLVLRSHCIS